MSPNLQIEPLRRSLWGMIRISTPEIRLSDVQVYHQPTVLNVAKAKMNSVGVTALDQVGNLRITNKLIINRGCLIANRSFIEESHLPVISGVSMPHDVLMAEIDVWPQYESVILADELDLTNKTIEIDRDHVLHLFIIARKIKAMSGAEITYRPLVNPNQGRKGANGRNGASFDRYNSNHDLNHAPDGGDGTDGGDGEPGPNGVDAPGLDIYVLDMDGMPDLILPGQKGGQGGRGGKGGRGGDGERGRNSKRKIVWGVPVDCINGPGWGGEGGDGGNGGRGGPGGTGSVGGNLLIATLEENLVDMVTANPFEIDVSPGEGGDPGVQGDRGKEGEGGLPGRNTAGWPCEKEPERGGGSGQPGQRTGDLGKGDSGSRRKNQDFDIITKEDWDLKLGAPWIISIAPNTGFPGEVVVINGVHFVRNSKVHYAKPVMLPSAGKVLNTDYLTDEKLKFTVPVDTQYGENYLYVITPDNDMSNSVPFHVRPQVDIIEIDGSPVTSVSLGDIIKIRGNAFSSEASVYYREEWLTPDSVVGNHTITLTLPSIEGEDAGGLTRIKVRNEDGLESDEVELQVLPTLDSGFRANPNGYAFENFSHGDPSWETFVDTFGTGEIVEEAFLNPVLLYAFYGFYGIYLSGGIELPEIGEILKAAYCTGISGTSLRRFHEGESNLYGAYKGLSTFVNPPPIPGDLMRKLVIAQGRLLSKELITHYAEQGQEGIDRIAVTIRDIEADFRDLRGVFTARTLSFIPSGNVWDSEYFGRLIESHCVVPTRIVYPDEARSLNGAKLYVYDSNHPGNDSRFIELFEKNGKLHFQYHGKFSSEDGFTLGTADLKSALLDDVDLPFSGSFGVMRFILDIVASSAWLRLEEAGGGLLGYKNGKIYTDPKFGYVSPFVPNYILTNAEPGKSFKRVICGVADGKYDFMSFHPDRKSVTLKDVDVNANTRDVIELSSDFSRIQITNSDPDKEFKLHLGEKVEEGIRIASVSFVIKQNEDISLDVSYGMHSILLNTPNRDIPIKLNMKSIVGIEVAHITRTIDLISNENLRIDVADWTNLEGSISLNKIVLPPFVIANCAEGLGLFDQECKDEEGKGYPVIDKQVLYEGKPTCNDIDMCGIQAHAGYYMIGSGGKEFEFDIDEYPILYLTMKAEKDTDTCLLLVVHDKKPRDFMRRCIVIGKTRSGNRGGVHLAKDCFPIEDDNKWHDYIYDLRKLRGDYPDVETVRMVQFYSGKLCNGKQHTFHFSSLVFKK